MGIYKCDTHIKKLFKGNTQIQKVYKGDSLVYTAFDGVVFNPLDFRWFKSFGSALQSSYLIYDVTQNRIKYGFNKFNNRASGSSYYPHLVVDNRSYSHTDWFVIDGRRTFSCDVTVRDIPDGYAQIRILKQGNVSGSYNPIGNITIAQEVTNQHYEITLSESVEQIKVVFEIQRNWGSDVTPGTEDTNTYAEVTNMIFS